MGLLEGNIVEQMSFKCWMKDWGAKDGESEGGDCDKVMRAGWGEPGGEWTEHNEQDKIDGTKKGADFTAEVIHI